MNDEQSAQFFELLDGVACGHGHRCAHDDLADVCRARDLGLENYVDCLSESPRDCEYSLSLGHGHLCRCPARIFLAKHGV